MTLLPTAAKPPEIIAPTEPKAPPRVRWRVGLACLVLLAASGLRFWQGRRVDAMMATGKTPPFALARLPERIGDWKGTDEKLDPTIARITGCSDYALRVYVNEKTGTHASLIVLYGPSIAVSSHTPEVCYPATGYALAAGPVVRTIKYPKDGKEAKAQFLGLGYSKGTSAESERQIVYYAWGYNGRWTPAKLEFKKFQRIPGIFKVQVGRLAGKSEKPGDDSEPCEALIRALLPEIEARLPRTGAVAAR